MNKHFFIDPAGQTHTRNSKSRTYSHAVIFRKDYEVCRRQAANVMDIDVTNFNYAQKQVETEGWSEWTKEESKQRDRDLVAKYQNGYEFAQAMAAKRVEDTDRRNAEGYYDEWICRGWNGRLDLAQKEAAKLNWEDIAEVKIVEAQLI
jgi:hypothetical protein